MGARTILWADDQIEELRSQILFLEGKGFEVVGVSNGDDAVSMVKKQRFDAILLDEMMPGRGGLETLRSIRDVEPSVPVIMITKSEEEELMDRALGRRIDDFLVKPVRPTQILMALKKALDEQKIQGQQVTQDYLSGFNELMRLRMEARDWRDWRDIYDRMVDWELQLVRFSDGGLGETHLEQFRESNAEFARFIEKRYQDWMSGDDAPVLSQDVFGRYVAPHLRAGKRVFFFLIDCMRLDQWRAVESLLEPHYHMERELFYSILPTATPFSRNAIFSGLTPLQIARQFPQWWRGSSREEKSKNAYEAQLMGKQLERLGLAGVRYKYFKTYNEAETETMRRQIPSLKGTQLVAGVLNFLDILSHGRSTNELLKELAPDEAAFRSVMRSWFQHSALYELLKELSDVPGSVVVITTDHGSVQGRRASMVRAKKEASTNLRYKYGDNLGVDSKEAFIMKKPELYGLPQDSPIQNYICAKEYYYFVYPTNFHDYERQYKGSFQHGGVSLEEMIVPAVTLKSR